MARQLANIFGSERDQVNCAFFHKIGACRFGETCSRWHHRPSASRTVLLKHMYHVPMRFYAPEGVFLPPELEAPAQVHVENFMLDVLQEMERFGEVEDLVVVRNMSPHIIGHVYVAFRSENAATAAIKAVQDRPYDGFRVTAEFSPVYDLGEARCRQFDDGDCNRGGECNFIHAYHVSREFHEELWGGRRPYHADAGRRGSRRRNR
jgi:splicing factor U2AF subunit